MAATTPSTPKTPATAVSTPLSAAAAGNTPLSASAARSTFFFGPDFNPEVGGSIPYFSEMGKICVFLNLEILNFPLNINSICKKLYNLYYPKSKISEAKISFVFL